MTRGLRKTEREEGKWWNGRMQFFAKVVYYLHLRRVHQKFEMVEIVHRASTNINVDEANDAAKEIIICLNKASFVTLIIAYWCIELLWLEAGGSTIQCDQIDKISPFLANIWGFISCLAKFRTSFMELFMFLGNFHCCKWPNIEK